MLIICNSPTVIVPAAVAAPASTLPVELASWDDIVTYSEETHTHTRDQGEKLLRKFPLYKIDYQSIQTRAMKQLKNAPLHDRTT